MAGSHIHHRSRFVWTWIILGIVVVVALIWWIGDTNTAPTQPMTTGAGAVDAAQPYGDGAADGAGAAGGDANTMASQPANPGAAGGTSPQASAAPATNAPATADNSPAE